MHATKKYCAESTQNDVTSRQGLSHFPCVTVVAGSGQVRTLPMPLELNPEWQSSQARLGCPLSSGSTQQVKSPSRFPFPGDQVPVYTSCLYQLAFQCPFLVRLLTHGEPTETLTWMKPLCPSRRKWISNLWCL